MRMMILAPEPPPPTRRRNGIDESTDEEPVIPPQATATVDFARRPVLYLLDGRALMRRAGF